MKGYRYLKEGEKFRQGDLVAVTMLDVPMGFWGVFVDAEADKKRLFCRKARTEGCPPGWRWADAGEEANHAAPNPITDYWVPYDVGGTYKPLKAPLDSKAGLGNYQLLMPYEDDERLEE